jgi:hypothetical protein
MFGLVNDPYFVLLILFCAAVMTIGALVTALSRVRRAEFARLQNDSRWSELYVNSRKSDRAAGRANH